MEKALVVFRLDSRQSFVHIYPAPRTDEKNTERISHIFVFVFYFLFFVMLQCIDHSFAYVPYLWFLRGVWIWTQSAAVPGRSINLATHSPNLASHLPQLSHPSPSTYPPIPSAKPPILLNIATSPPQLSHPSPSNLYVYFSFLICCILAYFYFSNLFSQ